MYTSKKVFLSFLALHFLVLTSQSQTNISISNPEAEAILSGNYNPQNYRLEEGNKSLVSYCDFINEVSPDTLRKLLDTLVSFKNRNTFSDTVSPLQGIGAARRWIMDRLRSYESPQFPKVVYSYLDFDIVNNTCGSGRLRNVLAIKPGLNPALPISIVEAHMDSRCGGRCDTSCIAHGADDNGSGTVMVMELLRVMSNGSYPGTIVYMLTTGEEQGLLGATAMAAYCQQEEIKIKAVFNNDIVGGVFCGKTASPPTACAGEGSIDSTRLRVFASSSEQSGSRNQARFVKLNYEKFLAGNVEVPMQIQIMGQEDRTGRGGDHIPFRQRAYNATRFTSAHEHGNGAGNSDPNYEDRQHSEDDIIGLDTNGDGVLDSLFVDFNYLARNTVINASMLAFASFADTAPKFSLNPSALGGTKLSLESSWEGKEFLVGVREANSTDTSFMFDAIYSFKNAQEFVIPGITDGKVYFIALASTSINEPVGIWSDGQLLIASQSTAASQEYQLPYFDCEKGPVGHSPAQTALYAFEVIPNPASQRVQFGVRGLDAFSIWELRLRDIRGRNILSKSLMGSTNFELNTQFLTKGLYLVQFIVEGKVMESKKLVISH